MLGGVGESGEVEAGALGACVAEGEELGWENCCWTWTFHSTERWSL